MVFYLQTYSQVWVFDIGTKHAGRDYLVFTHIWVFTTCIQITYACLNSKYYDTYNTNYKCCRNTKSEKTYEKARDRALLNVSKGGDDLESARVGRGQGLNRYNFRLCTDLKLMKTLKMRFDTEGLRLTLDLNSNWVSHGTLASDKQAITFLSNGYIVHISPTVWGQWSQVIECTFLSIL